MRALKPGRQDRLHQRLAGLEVLAADRHAVAVGAARACTAGRTDRFGAPLANGTPLTAARRTRRSGSGEISASLSSQALLERLDDSGAPSPGSRYASVDPHHTITRRSQPFSARNRSMSSISAWARSILVAPFLTRNAVELLHPARSNTASIGDDAFELAAIGARSRSSSTPAVRAASRALAEIGSQPPKTRSSSDGERHEVADQRVATLARGCRGGCGPSA